MAADTTKDGPEGRDMNTALASKCKTESMDSNGTEYVFFPQHWTQWWLIGRSIGDGHADVPSDSPSTELERLWNDSTASSTPIRQSTLHKSMAHAEPERVMNDYISQLEKERDDSRAEYERLKRLHDEATHKTNYIAQLQKERDEFRAECERLKRLHPDATSETEDTAQLEKDRNESQIQRERLATLVK
jgi:hypothetical protein